MNGLSFCVWSALAKALDDRTWQHGNESRLRELLTPYAEGAVYLRSKDDGSPCTGDVMLFSDEARAWAAYLECPSQMPPHEPVRWRRTSPVRIGDCLNDDEFLSSVFRRVKTLSLYDPEELPDFPEWHWCFEGSRHNFLVSNHRLVLPPGWEYRGCKIGPIFCRTTHLRIFDGQGRMGLVNLSGEVTTPCTFAYLGEPDGWGRIVACEAHRTEIPLHSGACDLVDEQGARLNPPNIKVVPGTLFHGFALAKREGDSTGLVGMMASDGKVLGDIRWSKVKEFSWQRAAVQDPETGLWGFIDQEGRVVIAPSFEIAGAFDDECAFVSPSGGGGLLGVIDREGRFVVPPVWKELKSFARAYFHVTAPGGEIGLVDKGGQIVIEPYHPGAEELQQIEEMRHYERGHPFMLTLGRRLRARVDEALAGSATLAPVAGLMANSGSDFELRFSGLRGRSVVLVEDYPILSRSGSAKAGERGTIGFSYPASASIFNFAIEAPVEGLPSWPQGSIGIPWRLLKLDESYQLQSGEAPS
ncbi:MAG: WG repeat-containing protein [Beijerinckiaceae bacterium]